MNRLAAFTAALLAVIGMPASGRMAESPLQSAAAAWEQGDYAGALTTYLRVLDSGAGEDAVEAIALQTGELYQTIELTADGAAPRFSPDGRFISYEMGSGPDRVTRIVRADGTAAPPLEVPGFGAVFSPDGFKIAYLKLAASPELAEAQAALRDAPASERAQRIRAVNQVAAAAALIVVRDIASGRETPLESRAYRKTTIAYGANGVLFAGAPAEGGPVQIYSATEGRPPVARTQGATDALLLAMNAPGTALLFTTRATGSAGADVSSQRSAGGPDSSATFAVLSMADDRTTTVSGVAPAFSGDGLSLAYVNRENEETRLMVAPVADPARGTVVRRGPERVEAPALSRDGSRLAYQLMTRDDWEVYTINRDGTGETRLTHDVQHDVLPVFLTADRVLAVTGEPRHRRSFLYDLPTLTRTRLFHNNTVRTIAPEYTWSQSPDGTKVLITAERDGDTVSPARGVYLADLTKRVTRAEVRTRVARNLETELALREAGRRMYAPIAATVRQVVSNASVERIYGYEKALFGFDSKYITRPGNKLAATYLFDTYKSFGYAPEYQPFEIRLRGGGMAQTANVIATLKGTVNPELVYVVSSHYDSALISPGADDDSSGTAALLETARILASHPQPATIVFASFTAEEAGLLGSAEFVRRAVADRTKVVGALNNDMIGWANDARIDTTVRYSNVGIRDVQHSAAMQFTNLITYDALYYKGTDAASYYAAYGDIVGGLGPYPVLSSPHYHQPHDVLETVNHRQVAEVAKTTAATLMLLASSPSRVKDLTVDAFSAGTATLSWTRSPEKNVTAYVVAYGPAAAPHARQVRVASPPVTLTGVAPGTSVSVKAVNARGLEGWDWSRIALAAPEHGSSSNVKESR